MGGAGYTTHRLFEAALQLIFSPTQGGKQQKCELLERNSFERNSSRKLGAGYTTPAVRGCHPADLTHRVVNSKSLNILERNSSRGWGGVLYYNTGGAPAVRGCPTADLFTNRGNKQQKCEPFGEKQLCEVGYKVDEFSRRLVDW